MYTVRIQICNCHVVLLKVFMSVSMRRHMKEMEQYFSIGSSEKVKTALMPARVLENLHDVWVASRVINLNMESLN